MRSVLLCLLLIAFIDLKSQDREVNVKAGTIPGVEVFNRGSDTKGSPYLIEDWVMGGVNLNGSLYHVNQKVKYDIYRDELLIQYPKSAKLMLVPTERINAFNIYTNDGDTLRFKNIDQSFYEILLDGSVTLLTSYNKYLLEADKGGSYSTRADNEIVAGKNKFYLRIGNGELNQIKMSLKSISSMLPEYTQVLKTFVKKNSLNLKEKEDLIKLIAYHNANIQ